MSFTFRYLGTVALLLIFSNISGCISTNQSLAPSNTTKGVVLGAATGALIGVATNVAITPGAVAGGVIGGVVGYSLDARLPAIQRIQHQGAQVIELGEYTRIILPADRIFVPGTPRLNTNYYPVLNTLISAINSYEKIVVKVTSYTDNTGDEVRDVALTRQQAENLAHYLWMHGVDARLLGTEGCGSSRPIASNATSLGRAANRRVEITFWRLTVSE